MHLFLSTVYTDCRVCSTQFCSVHLSPSTVYIDFCVCSTPFCSVPLLCLLYTLTTVCSTLLCSSYTPFSVYWITDCRVFSTPFCYVHPSSSVAYRWLLSIWHRHSLRLLLRLLYTSGCRAFMFKTPSWSLSPSSSVVYH